MSVSEDLKLTAQLRKAIRPLIGILKKEADKDLNSRLDLIEMTITKLVDKEIKVNVKAPDITVSPADVDVDSIVKAIKSQDTAAAPNYEPHDQAKTGIYQYSGQLADDGSWYIQRVAKGEQRYAKGNGTYADAWEKRSKLKYGYLDGSK